LSFPVKPPWYKRLQLDGLAESHLCSAGGVVFGGVEAVDPIIIGGFDTLKSLFVIDVTTVCNPGSKRQHRDLEASPAEETAFQSQKRQERDPRK
jgi:hypothetical protein